MASPVKIRHGLDKLWEVVREREPWYAAVHGVAKNVIELSD